MTRALKLKKLFVLFSRHLFTTTTKYSKRENNNDYSPNKRNIKNRVFFNPKKIFNENNENRKRIEIDDIKTGEKKKDKKIIFKHSLILIPVMKGTRMIQILPPKEKRLR